MDVMSKESAEDVDLRKLVDATGFAFQTAVQKLVELSSSSYQVLATEHAWVHPESGQTGFADIILEGAGNRLVIECKRIRGNGQWVFLRPERQLPASTTKSRRVEVLWTGVSATDSATSVDRVFFVPETSQCPFCVVRGSGEDQQPMLERVSSLLLSATEAIAQEQVTIDLAHRHRPSSLWFYVPVIVTNADLRICSFDPAKVDASDGLLPSDATFEKVKAVRFFKNLSFRLDPGRVGTLTAANLAKNRTIIVVNATALQEFLREFEAVEGLPDAARRFI
jgi:hypothetical protein